MQFRALSPRAASIALIAFAACGGGGAAVPTEPDTATPPDSAQAPPPPTSPPNDSTPAGPAAPATATVSALKDDVFMPASVTIAAGGTVTFYFEEDHDVTFDGPTPDEGNVPEAEDETSVTRTFSEPGTYTYHCSKHADDGMTGTIVVVEGGGGAPPVNPGPQSSATVTTPGVSFSPPTVRIVEGGTVTWQFSGARHNVTFNGAAPAGGSIPDTESGSVARTFDTAGNYAYACTRHSGMNGTVIVEATP